MIAGVCWYSDLERAELWGSGWTWREEALIPTTLQSTP